MTKTIIMILAATFAVSAHAKKTESLCETKAQAAVNKFFDSYYEDFRKEAQAQADEEGEELNEDALPNGLDLSQPAIVENGKETFSYGWAEREECSCGIDVTGTASKDGKSCKSVRVNYKTQSCECG